MSDIFSAAGQVWGASIQANAMKEATQMQIDALQKQKDFVFQQLDPSSINAQAQQADITRAQNQLALQGQIDPALLAQRYASEGAIAKTAGELASGNTPADQVAATAAKEAIAGTPGAEDAKKALVDSALKELAAGATLPPDVQAQLVQTGLQKTGQVTGRANASGVGGQVLSTLLGTAGINLKQQREQQAAALMGSAQDLESKRQNILQGLFPNLQATQLNNLTAQQNALKTSNSMAPTVGLGGTDVSNLWLARVGATNQLAQTQANAAAQGTAAQGQIWGNAVANAAPYAANSAGGGASSAYNWAKGLFGAGGGGGGNYNTTPVDTSGGGSVTSEDL
jgi:hypothetical protein